MLVRIVRQLDHQHCNDADLIERQPDLLDVEHQIDGVAVDDRRHRLAQDRTEPLLEQRGIVQAPMHVGGRQDAPDALVEDTLRPIRVAVDRPPGMVENADDRLPRVGDPMLQFAKQDTLALIRLGEFAGQGFLRMDDGDGEASDQNPPDRHQIHARGNKQVDPRDHRQAENDQRFAPSEHDRNDKQYGKESKRRNAAIKPAHTMRVTRATPYKANTNSQRIAGRCLDRHAMIRVNQRITFPTPCHCSEIAVVVLTSKDRRDSGAHCRSRT